MQPIRVKVAQARGAHDVESKARGLLVAARTALPRLITRGSSDLRRAWQQVCRLQPLVVNLVVLRARDHLRLKWRRWRRVAEKDLLGLHCRSRAIVRQAFGIAVEVAVAVLADGNALTLVTELHNGAGRLAGDHGVRRVERAWRRWGCRRVARRCCWRLGQCGWRRRSARRCLHVAQLAAGFDCMEGAIKVGIVAQSHVAHRRARHCQVLELGIARAEFARAVALRHGRHCADQLPGSRASAVVHAVSCGAGSDGP